MAEIIFACVFIIIFDIIYQFKGDTKNGEPKYHEVFIEEYSDIPETTLEALRILQTEFKKWDMDGGNFGTDKYSLNYDLYNC